ncbi:hypothetical protein [Salipiger thiooxidans]|jgi:hypothetical protein|nr:hypothetical protein [Salipiger thiooxidans]MCA0845984.1 hypothetical protein [Salipiger thiooxidans]
MQEVQLNIRAPGPVMERLRATGQRERRNHGNMLSILIGVWDGDAEKTV